MSKLRDDVTGGLADLADKVDLRQVADTVVDTMARGKDEIQEKLAAAPRVTAVGPKVTKAVAPKAKAASTRGISIAVLLVIVMVVVLRARGRSHHSPEDGQS